MMSGGMASVFFVRPPALCELMVSGPRGRALAPVYRARCDWDFEKLVQRHNSVGVEGRCREHIDEMAVVHRTRRFVRSPRQPGLELVGEVRGSGDGTAECVPLPSHSRVSFRHRGFQISLKGLRGRIVSARAMTLR